MQAVQMAQRTMMGRTPTTSVVGGMRPMGFPISMPAPTSGPLFSTPALHTEAHSATTGDVYLGRYRNLLIGNALSHA